jgi:hypothetical protein
MIQYLLQIYGYGNPFDTFGYSCCAIVIVCIVVVALIYIFIIRSDGTGGKKTVIVQQPVSQDKSSDRCCPACGRAIPFDARVCPYCSKKFDDK